MAIVNWRRSVITAASMILLNGLLGGCTTVTLSADELAAVRGDKETLVLIRLVCGEPEHEFPDFLEPQLKFRNGELEMHQFAYIDEREKPHSINSIAENYRWISKASWSDGWLVLIQPPRYQYLTFGYRVGNIVPLGPILIPGSSALAPGAPIWRIEVSSGAPVIYVGTFRDVSCGSNGERTRHARLYAQASFGQNGSTVHIEDEREAAATVISRDLPTLPPPVTRLAVLQTGPIMPGVPPP